MPFLGLILLLIFFCIGLLFIMYKVLGGQAKKVTAHLSELNSDYYKKTDEIKELKAKSEQEARAAISASQEESERLKKEALLDADDKKSKIIDKAQQEAERIVSEAKQNRQNLKDELLKELENKAIDRACELVRDLLSTKFREEAHKQWLDELIETGLAQLSNIPSTERSEHAKIITAFPLSNEQQTKLSQQLQSALGYEVTLEEEVNDTVVAGLIIKLGHLVIDGSMASKLREAAQRAQNAIQ